MYTGGTPAGRPSKLSSSRDSPGYDTRNQPVYRIDDDQRGGLAGRQDIVAYADLVGHIAVYDALVDAFVAAAQYDQTLFARQILARRPG